MKKKQKKEDGAPAWMVTYGDMMSLLLCFFVILVSMSEIKKDTRFQEVMQSVRRAFGYIGGIGQVPTKVDPRVSIVMQLQHIQIPDEIKTVGAADDRSIEGKYFRVTQIRDSYKITFGGLLQFERFSDRLLSGREKILENFAKDIQGTNNIIEIVGHTTREDVPPESGFAGKYELGFARARRVHDILVGLGIDARRIRLQSVADHEPRVRQAYTEDRRSLNRRVEVIVSEQLINEFDGMELTSEVTVNDGG